MSIYNFTKFKLLSFVGLFRLSYKNNLVLCYHSITDDNWDFSVSPNIFELQLRQLLIHRQVIDLDDCIDGNKGGLLSITFDDGYKDVFTRAFPILKKYNLTACVFINNLGESTINDRRTMNTKELKTLIKNGWQIGYHTKNHIDCTLATPAELAQELMFLPQIEKRLGTKIIYFAYPYGKLNRLASNQIKAAGFCRAFTVNDGAVHNEFDISRLTVSRAIDAKRIRVLSSDQGVWLSGLLHKVLNIYKYFYA